MNEQIKKSIDASYRYLEITRISTEKIEDVRVEEIVPDGDDLCITLSWNYVGTFAFDRQKVYKVFKISPQLEVLKMSILSGHAETS